MRLERVCECQRTRVHLSAAGRAAAPHGHDDLDRLSFFRSNGPLATCRLLGRLVRLGRRQGATKRLLETSRFELEFACWLVGMVAHSTRAVHLPRGSYCCFSSLLSTRNGHQLLTASHLTRRGRLPLAARCRPRPSLQIPPRDNGLEPPLGGDLQASSDSDNNDVGATCA